MSSSSTCSCPPHKNVHDHQRKPFPIPIERTPRMLLKDFLNENSKSCSSSGFKSFPRQLPSNPIGFDPKARNQNSNSNNNRTITSKLLRSRSKAASTTISALQSLMHAVKNIPFTAVKSPSFLPRSLSRRLLHSKHSSRSSRSSKSSRNQSQNQVQITVRVKDIIRWTSVRDEELPPHPPLDFASSPLHCTTSTTITGSTRTTTTTTCTTCSSNSCSNGSSWCESDFTSEYLHSWGGNSEEGGEKYLPCVGKDPMEATTGIGSCTALAPQVEALLCDEDEQRSPVSVLGFQFGEDEEETSFSNTFDQSIANVQRTKEMLMQKIKHFESLATLDSVNLDTWMSLEERTNIEEEEEEEDGMEERAMELLNYVKARSSTLDSCEANTEDKLLLDFFREEMSAYKNIADDGFNWEMVSKAKAWVSEENNAIEWGKEHKKEACVRDMHKGGRWNKFEREQEELALEIESALSRYLMDELLVDLLSR